MTIGTGTFLPQPRFAFPRSYIYELNIGTYGDTVTQSGSQFTIHDTLGGSPTIAIIEIAPHFMPWSSNGWTLDHIVTEFYTLINGIPPKLPNDFTLSYGFDVPRHRASLFLEWFVTSPAFHAFPLAAQPPDYWLPKPLP